MCSAMSICSCLQPQPAHLQRVAQEEGQGHLEPHVARTKQEEARHRQQVDVVVLAEDLRQPQVLLARPPQLVGQAYMCAVE